MNHVHASVASVVQRLTMVVDNPMDLAVVTLEGQFPYKNMEGDSVEEFLV